MEGGMGHGQNESGVNEMEAKNIVFYRIDCFMWDTQVEHSMSTFLFRYFSISPCYTTFHVFWFVVFRQQQQHNY